MSIDSKTLKVDKGLKYLVSFPCCGLKWLSDMHSEIEANLNNLRDFYDNDDSIHNFQNIELESSASFVDLKHVKCGWIYGGNVLPIAVKAAMISVDAEDFRLDYRSASAVHNSNRFQFHDFEDIHPFIITISSVSNNLHGVEYSMDIILGTEDEISMQHG